MTSIQRMLRRLLLLALVAALVAAAPAASLAKKTYKPTVLVAKGGKNDGYGMTLTKAGKQVKTLKHGGYWIYVHDYSDLHNIRIKGPGVNKWTTVPEIAAPIWKIYLRKGVYTVVCDPHPVTMKFTFKVT
jgi:hypothetical protein